MDIYGRIREFYDRLETNPLTSAQIALWFALLHTNNKARWIEWFSVASSVLTSRTGLDRKGINRARNTLKQRGYIDFKTNGNTASAYTLCYAQNGMASDMASDMADGRSSGMASDMAGDTIKKTNTNMKTNTKIKTPPNPPKGADPLFDQFWAAYPKKVAKEAARKAFDKLKPDDDLLGAMLKAIEQHKRSDQWAKDGGQFIPNPTTWLNQKRWEDEIKPGGGKKVAFQDYDEGPFDISQEYTGIDILAEAREA